MSTENIFDKPGLLIRWGTAIFIFVLGIIFFAAWFVQYPDIIIGRAKFTSAVKTNMNGEKNAEYFVEVNTSQEDLKKVKTGQQVSLKFISYPSREYELMSGTIVLISNKITDIGYPVKMILPKELKFNERYTQVEIITRNKRVLYRAYQKISSLFR